MTRSYSCQQKLAQFQKFPEIDTICNERGRQDIHANRRKKYNKKEQLPMNKKKKEQLPMNKKKREATWKQIWRQQRSDLETNLVLKSRPLVFSFFPFYFD